MENQDCVMLTLFLQQEIYQRINHILKYKIQNDTYLDTILGVVTIEKVSVIYKLNRDYTIQVVCLLDQVKKFDYRLIVNHLSEINDVIHINKKKHQLQILPL